MRAFVALMPKPLEIKDELSIKNNNFNDTNETASENSNLHVCLANQSGRSMENAV